MEPSIPVSISISIANKRRILLGPIILREKFPVRARRELERRNRKKINSNGRRRKARRERRGEGEEETRNRGNEKSWTWATHHECPHGCCCSLIWGLMLRGCLVAPFYTGQLGGPTRCLDPSPMRCDGAIANLSPSFSFSLSLSLGPCLFLRYGAALLKFVSVLSLKFIHSILIASASTCDTLASG